MMVLLGIQKHGMWLKSMSCLKAPYVLLKVSFLVAGTADRIIGFSGRTGPISGD